MITYDEKVYDLAVLFLSDPVPTNLRRRREVKLTSEEIEALAPELARAIQQTIEDNLPDLAQRALAQRGEL